MKHIDISGLQPHQENIPTPSCHTQGRYYFYAPNSRQDAATD